jgi:hypothetical protein
VAAASAAHVLAAGVLAAVSVGINLSAGFSASDWLLGAVDALLFSGLVASPLPEPQRAGTGAWPADVPVESRARTIGTWLAFLLPLQAMWIVIPALVGTHDVIGPIWSGMLLGNAGGHAIRLVLWRRYEVANGVVLYGQRGGRQGRRGGQVYARSVGSRGSAVRRGSRSAASNPSPGAPRGRGHGAR